jgi:hypothetical protein
MRESPQATVSVAKGVCEKVVAGRMPGQAARTISAISRRIRPLYASGKEVLLR